MASTRNSAKREAARQRDAELAEKADAALADPAIGERVAALVGTSSGRVLRYSVRNQALLMKQAEERGIEVTDVDTFKGWIGRGRAVRRGEHGMRIVRPVGRAAAEEDGADQEQDQDQADAAEQDEQPVKFRSMVVFDISQTDGIEDADEVTDEADRPEGAEAAAVLLESLTEQAERAGYQVTRQQDAQPDGEAVQVDHEARTVDVRAADSAALAELAAAVAEILSTRARRRKQTRRDEDGPEGEEVLTITAA